MLIVVGGIVRTTGSGLGCPDWPLCFGEVVPPPRKEAWIEVSHRWTAAITSVLLIGSLILAWWPKRRPSSPWITAAVAVLAGQIVLGAVVVLQETPAGLVNIHLISAFVIFALSVVGVVRSVSSRAPVLTDRTLGQFAISTAFALFGLLLSGSYVFGSGSSLSCGGFPLCADNTLPVTTRDLINFAHRSIAGFVGILSMILAWRAWRVRHGTPFLGVAAVSLVVLFVAQATFGILVVLTKLGWPWPALHLAAATAIWAVTVALAAYLVQPIEETVRPNASWRETVGAYFALTKPTIVLLLVITLLLAMVIAAGGLPPIGLVIWTLIGGYLSAGGANAINCYFDRDIDVVMKRTKRRGIVSGIIGPQDALVFGVTLGALSVIVFAIFVNLLAAILSLAGFLFYVLIYTLMLKRSTVHNIVIGGAAGSFPPVVGWAAATGQVDLAAWYLFAVIFFWTPPHFWALALITKSDYANANIPMLPVKYGDEETRRQILLYSILLVPVTLLLFGGQAMGLLYLVAAGLLGALFVWYAVRLYRERTEIRAKKLFVFSNGYLALLFAAMVLDRVLRG